jgi:hypothetical protein
VQRIEKEEYSMTSPCDDDRHTILTHLSVEVVSAGADMIENIGVLKGVHRLEGALRSYQMDDLRRAIKKASDAIAAYDECETADISQPTSDEWNIALARSSVKVSQIKELEDRGSAAVAAAKVMT